MQKRSRIIPMLLVLALVSCGPAITQDTSPKSLESKQVKSEGFLRVGHRIPEPTVEPTSVVISFPARVSFYSNSVEEGTNGRTALGQPTSRGMVAVAYRLDERGRAIPVIPFGTQVRLEGLGVYTVADTCPSCEDTWLDVYTESREEAFRLGVKRTTATIERKR